jgi:hypothetical protein
VDSAAALIGENAHLLRARGEDLQILEYCRAKLDGQLAPLRNELNRALDPPDEALSGSPVHAALADLDRCDIYYTTNYDSFLERAISLSGRVCSAVATEANLASYLESRSSADGGRSPCRVVKFHGDLDNPEQMVLSDSDYRDRLQFTEPLDTLLRSDLLGRAVLFLGYSFRDWNVSYLFHLVGRDFGAARPGVFGGPRAYIAVSDPSDFERSLFAARNIGVIPIGSEDRAGDIASLLGEVGRE